MQKGRLRLVLSLVASLAASGCIVVADDNDRHRDRDRDRDRDRTVVVEERHDGDRDRDRDRDRDQPPPPPSDPQPQPQPQQPQEDMRFPYMGEYESQFTPGQNEIWLKRGYYKVHHDDWKCKMNGIIVHGISKDETRIQGSMELHGNNNVWSNMTIVGDLHVYGANNTLQNVWFIKGSYHDHGRGNHYSGN